jgi:hypothetical protein
MIVALGWRVRIFLYYSESVKRKKEWAPPSENLKKKTNAKHVRNLVAEESEATNH